MKRRDFLKAAGLSLAPSMLLVSPSADSARDWFRDLLRHARESSIAPVGADYVAFMHPSVVAILREAQARSLWASAWRSYRIARRENVCGYLPPAAILARFNGPGEFAPLCEVGRFHGMRFIETKDIAA